MSVDVRVIPPEFHDWISHVTQSRDSLSVRLECRICGGITTPTYVSAIGTCGGAIRRTATTITKTTYETIPAEIREVAP